MAQLVPAPQADTDAELGAVVPAGVASIAEERVSVASQWQLMWWRFRKHKLAMISAVVVMIFYFAVLFCDFLAYSDPEVSEAQRGLIAPQPLHWVDSEGNFGPYVEGLSGKRDPLTFKRVYAPDPNVKVPITFFGHGFEYKMLGFIPMDRHLLSVPEGMKAEESIFIMGTDIQGRDMWSRLMYATRISLTIGLVSWW